MPCALTSVPTCGPKISPIYPSNGPKKAKKNDQNWNFSRLWPYGTPYLLEQVGMWLEQHLGHPGWSVWPICQTQNVALLGPKRSHNMLKKPFGHRNQQILGGKWWKKFGTPMKTSIQTSFGHLPHPECPKGGPTGTKEGPKLDKHEIQIVCHKSY